MSTGLSDDLWASTSVSEPASIADAGGPPSNFGADWEISSVDGLSETSSPPYCVGDTVSVQMAFTGAGTHFDSIRLHEPNYSVNTTQNCTFDTQQGGSFNFTIDAGSGGTTGNVIGVTFDAPFNTASGVGVEQQMTFDVSQFGVTINSSSYDSNADDVTITYTIEACGTPDYEVEMQRDVDGNDGGPDVAATDTKTSAGQYTIIDTNPDSHRLSDDYKITVVDDSGNGTLVSDTTTVNFPN